MTNWRAIVAIESRVILFIGAVGGIVVSKAGSAVQRDGGSDRYREALRARNRRLMDIEIAQQIAPVTVRLEGVDRAIAGSRFDEAQAAWHEAYGAAIRTRRWEPMLAVGDAAVRLAEQSPALATQYANARRSYLAAFIRAREVDSFDGLLRSAEAFARLGDRHVVDVCLRAAEGVARDDAERLARVRALATSLR